MRNHKIDNIRCFAILSVILGHSIIIYSNSWNLYSSVYNSIFFDKMKDIINIFQMPLFFSFSGFLFALKQKKIKNLMEFTINKIKRLIIPFLCIGIFWMIPIKKMINYKPYYGKAIWKIILEFIFGNEMGHLWYLIALFFIFIFAYFILFKAKKKVTNLNTYYLIIFIVTAIVAILGLYNCYNIPIIGSAINNFNYFVLRLFIF